MTLLKFYKTQFVINVFVRKSWQLNILMRLRSALKAIQEAEKLPTSNLHLPFIQTGELLLPNFSYLQYHALKHSWCPPSPTKKVWRDIWEWKLNTLHLFVTPLTKTPYHECGINFVYLRTFIFYTFKWTLRGLMESLFNTSA